MTGRKVLVAGLAERMRGREKARREAGLGL